MSNYLVDTTFLIDHLRGNEKIGLFLERHTPHFSSVSLAELIQGSQDRREMLRAYDLCSSLPELSIDRKVCSQAIALTKSFHLSHGLRFLDALIAASALKNSLLLVTNNMKHFRFIKELQVMSHQEAFALL